MADGPAGGDESRRRFGREFHSGGDDIIRCYVIDGDVVVV
jgi:hypothetical protein